MFKYFPQDEELEWVKQTGHRGWSYQMIRLISEAHHGGGQFSEAHEAARQMRYGDIDSWWEEWKKLGARLEKMAQEAEQQGHGVSAKARYLRAFNYFRTGEFFISPHDPRKLEAYDRAVSCFLRAGRHFKPPLEKVEIPYEGTILPGYFLPGENAGNQEVPAVIFFGGADTIAEELYFLAPGVRERGMGLLILDGPGQGAPLRHHGLTSRPDWEVPAGAAYDYLVQRSGIDSKRIALMALSFGGYLGPRAAAFDHRFAALVVWGPHYDLHEFWTRRPDDHPLAENWQWLLGTPGMAATRERMKDFTLRGILHQIECPTFVLSGEGEGEFRVELGRRMFSELRCPKTFKLFTSEETGSEHCQMDNLALVNEYIGDWLMDVLVHEWTPPKRSVHK